MLRDLWSDIRFRLRVVFRRASVERELEDELRFHVEREAERLVRDGESPAAARRRARLTLGGVERLKESVRDARGIGLLSVVEQDVRYCARSLRRTPLFTLTAVLTLALGIGVNVALFSVLDRFFLRTPPGVGEAGNVWRLVQRSRRSARTDDAVSNRWNYPDYRSLAEAMPSGVRAAAYYTDGNVLLGEGRAARPGVISYVADQFFGVLGVTPASGRFFDENETGAHALSPFAVISYQLWQTEYGLANDIAGKTIDVGSHRYTIVGVAPERFRGIDLDNVDVWVPLNTLGAWDQWSPASVESPRMTAFRIVLRIPSDAPSTAVASAATNQLRTAGTHPDSTAVAQFLPLRNALDAGLDAAEGVMTRRLAIVAIVILLIACTNVANLLLVRAMQRRREIGTRIALGVSRSRLFAQHLMEALVLSALGGCGALSCAAWLSRALGRELLPAENWDAQTLGFRAIAFTAAAVGTVGLTAGIVPALQASKSDLVSALHGGAGLGSSERARWRSGLLIAQVSLSTALLITGGLLVRSLRNVESVDLGYETDGLVDADVVPFMTYSSRDAQTYREISAALPGIADLLARVPGVERVALADFGPLQGFGFAPIFLPDRDTLPMLGNSLPITKVVSPDFFQVSGVRILDGRAFNQQDREGAERVVVVSAGIAHWLWPGTRAVGKCVIVGKRENACRTVVGVVSDSHARRILEQKTMTQVFIPLAQADSMGFPSAILVRARPGRTRDVVAGARAVFAPMTERWGVPRVRAMSEVLAPELHPWRIAATLFTAAAVLALIVAAVGVYGTIAYSVTQRTHELGVRVALGAHGADILRLIVGGGIRLVLVGLVAGSAFALMLGRVVASMLYHTSAGDPIVFLGVGVMILGVAVLACAIPAWRATRADPLVSLRAE